MLGVMSHSAQFCTQATRNVSAMAALPRKRKEVNYSPVAGDTGRPVALA